jgi:rhodanese-related sulfurtransferase
MKARTLTLVVAAALSIATFAAVLAWPLVAQQQSSRIISAAEAHSRALTGEVVLVDVRTPEEWRETGLPASAHAITMHQDPRAFVQQLLAALDGDPSRPLAIICRTGNRTGGLAPQLTRAGFGNVVDVGEGVSGSRFGRGWFKSGLPTRPGSLASIPPKPTAKASAR